MRDIPQRVSEELLPWVQVTPYHLNNSVNYPGTVTSPDNRTKFNKYLLRVSNYPLVV